MKALKHLVGPTGRAPKLATALVGVGGVAMFAITGASPALARTVSSGGTAASVYNAIPSKVPGNVPSLGFEATGRCQFENESGFGATKRTAAWLSFPRRAGACKRGTWNGNGGSCTPGPGPRF